MWSSVINKKKKKKETQFCFKKYEETLSIYNIEI